MAGRCFSPGLSYVHVSRIGAVRIELASSRAQSECLYPLGYAPSLGAPRGTRTRSPSLKRRVLVPVELAALESGTGRTRTVIVCFKDRHPSLRRPRIGERTRHDSNV